LNLQSSFGITRTLFAQNMAKQDNGAGMMKNKEKMLIGFSGTALAVGACAMLWRGFSKARGDVIFKSLNVPAAFEGFRLGICDSSAGARAKKACRRVDLMLTPQADGLRVLAGRSVAKEGGKELVYRDGAILELMGEKALAQRAQKADAADNTLRIIVSKRPVSRHTLKAKGAHFGLSNRPGRWLPMFGRKLVTARLTRDI
jgi:hypothetical protein